jgi:hypothetical protein
MLQFLGTGFTAYLKIQAAWERGRVIPGCDRQVWRKDAGGFLINRSAYEDSASPHGWRIDHPEPESLTRSGEIATLRPVRWAA